MKVSSPSAALSILAVLLGLGAFISAWFAGLDLSVGYYRGGFLGDGLLFFQYGIVFAVIAGIWSFAGLLLLLRKWGGGGLALVGASLAVVHGLSRLTQSPAFGISGTTAGGIPVAVWTTTVIGALIVVCVLADIAIDIIRNYQPPEEE